MHSLTSTFFLKGASYGLIYSMTLKARDSLVDQFPFFVLIETHLMYHIMFVSGGLQWQELLAVI